MHADPPMKNVVRSVSRKPLQKLLRIFMFRKLTEDSSFHAPVLLGTITEELHVKAKKCYLEENRMPLDSIALEMTTDDDVTGALEVHHLMKRVICPRLRAKLFRFRRKEALHERSCFSLVMMPRLMIFLLLLKHQITVCGTNDDQQSPLRSLLGL